MADLIEFGKIVNTHGLKGEVKVYSYTDNEANILKLKKVYINGTKYDVQSIKPFKNMFIMTRQTCDINNILTQSHLRDTAVWFQTTAMKHYCDSATKSCPDLCDPMNCSMPCSPVLHHPLELAQTHVH